MTKEDLNKKIESLLIFRIIGKLQIISILLIIISPFIFIWYKNNFAFKILFSGLIAFIIFRFISYILKKAKDLVIEDELKNQKKHESKFKKRLEEVLIKKENE